MTAFVPTPTTIRPPALVRFSTTGLLATIDSYRAGRLPLHRFAWELHTRIDALAEHGPPARTLTRLRWLQRGVEHLHSRLATSRRQNLTKAERDSLTATLADLRTVLANLTLPDPPDPAGVA